MSHHDSEVETEESSLGFNLLLIGIISLVAVIIGGNTYQDWRHQQTMHTDHSDE
jgi:uncharacterized protein (DUF779 family)